MGKIPYIYVLKNAFDLYKIGITTNLTQRIRTIENSSGVPITNSLCFYLNDVDSRIVEANLHEYHDTFRTVGEWFSDVDWNYISKVKKGEVQLPDRFTGCYRQFIADYIVTRSIWRWFDILKVLEDNGLKSVTSDISKTFKDLGYIKTTYEGRSWFICRNIPVGEYAESIEGYLKDFPE